MEAVECLHCWLRAGIVKDVTYRLKDEKDELIDGLDGGSLRNVMDR